MQVVQVNRFSSETTQRLVTVTCNVIRVGIQADTVIAPRNAEFSCDLQIVAGHATGRYGATYQRLVMALAIAYCGIKQRNPSIKSSMNGRDGLGIISRPVPLIQTHAAKA